MDTRLSLSPPTESLGTRLVLILQGQHKTLKPENKILGTQGAVKAVQPKAMSVYTVLTVEHIKNITGEHCGMSVSKQLLDRGG